MNTLYFTGPICSTGSQGRLLSLVVDAEHCKHAKDEVHPFSLADIATTVLISDVPMTPSSPRARSFSHPKTPAASTVIGNKIMHVTGC